MPISNPYNTQANDVLDAIAYQYYGFEGTVEAVYTHNRHLAGYGTVLPAGVTVEWPNITPPAQEAESIRLW